MPNCERCGKEFERRRDIPKFVVCETELCALYCSGYATYEMDLCPDCEIALEKFMEVRNDGDD